MMNKTAFTGIITSVKARIRLLRSFDEVPSHQYQGYVLIMDGEIGGESRTSCKIAIGPKAHEQHQFRIGDKISGMAIPVVDADTEWAHYYKVSALKLIERTQHGDLLPTPEGGVAPALEKYREQGHFRLHHETCETKCFRCPFGLTMATEITVDQWNQSKVKWRFETNCYGPRDCPLYKSGPPYRVPGRKSGMVYVDDDVERAEHGE
ncbi:MAG: hypothetical protein AABY86_09185 [Bdellovibrionota bacterium]